MERNKNFSRILWVVSSAMLLALVVVAQMLTKAIPAVVIGPFTLKQLVTGSLVNLVLVVGAVAVGFSATAVAGVLSPVLAFLLGQMPAVPPMILVVAAGNLILILVIWGLFKIADGFVPGGIRTGLQLLALVLGAALKCALLWLATVKLVIPLFSIKAPVAQVLTASFSVPQLITALIGGFLALAVLPAVKAYQKR